MAFKPLSLLKGPAFLIPGVNTQVKKGLKSVGNELTGTKEHVLQSPTLTPEQQQFQNQNLTGVNQLLQNLLQQYNPQGTQGTPLQQRMNTQGDYLQGSRPNIDAILDYYKKQFQTETLPQMMEQFGATPGGTLSSNYLNTNPEIASNYDLGAANLKAQLGMQQRGQEAGIYGQYQQGALQERQLQQALAGLMTGTGMHQAFENTMIPGQSGMLQQLLPVLMRALSMYATGGAF